MKVVQDRSCHCFLDVVVVLGKELLVALGESKIFEHLLVELPVSLRLHQLHDALAAETVLWDLSMLATSLAWLPPYWIMLSITREVAYLFRSASTVSTESGIVSFSFDLFKVRL